MNKGYEERRKKVEEFYQNNPLVLIGMNDYAHSSFLTNNLLKMIAKEIKAKGLKNLVEYKLGNKTIYVFDNHNHAFYFWNKSLLKNEFNKGCKLVHVDQHKDMREPDNYNVNIENLDDVFTYTNEVLNVGNFIQPALKKGIFSQAIIIDSSYGFDVEVDEEYVLDIDLDIFSKDMDYIPYDFRIDKIKKLIENAKVITIATSPYFIEQDYAIKVLKELFNCDIIE